LGLFLYLAEEALVRTLRFDQRPKAA